MVCSRLLASIALAGAAVAASTAGAAFGASAAPADVSANWAGYTANGLDAMTGAPKRFSSVSGTWTQPRARCTSAFTTGESSAAFWVGLGGNSQQSSSLEQVGTEADCSSAGVARYSAWYELVPASSVKIRLAISPGDKVAAAVSVKGTRVTVTMRNLTRGTAFSRVLTMREPDTSSAEWIVEAPSVCADSQDCRQISLPDFGTVAFSGARATSGGRTGTISDPRWVSTPVSLEARGGGFGHGRFGRQIAVAQAVPSALASKGSAFTVTASGETAPSGFGDGGGFGNGGDYGGGGYAGPVQPA